MFPVDFPDLAPPKAIKHHSDRMFLHLQLRGSCLGDHRWYPPLGPQNRWYTGNFCVFFWNVRPWKGSSGVVWNEQIPREIQENPHLIIFDPFVCWREVQWLTGSHNITHYGKRNSHSIMGNLIWVKHGWRVARFWTPIGYPNPTTFSAWGVNETGMGFKQQPHMMGKDGKGTKSK